MKLSAKNYSLITSRSSTEGNLEFDAKNIGEQLDFIVSNRAIHMKNPQRAILIMSLSLRQFSLW